MLPIIDKRKLFQLTSQMRDHNVFPVLLVRFDDVESNHPVSQLLADLTRDVYEGLMACTDDELLAAMQTISRYSASRLSRSLVLAREESTIRSFAVAVITDATQETYLDFRTYLRDDYLANSVVYGIYPELASYHTDEGLLRLDVPGLKLTDHGLFYKDHFLYCHQFLRRYFTSNPNFDFLRILASYRRQHPDQSSAIAIDHSRILPLEWFAIMVEKDHWFGPPLAWPDIDDPHTVGLTVYGRPQDSIHNFAEKIEKTEFFWSYRHGLKTIQIEEIRPLPPSADGVQVLLNRYLHSQRDIARHTFVHLDGAVKAYDRPSYQVRHSTKMPNAQKGNYKIKLFRIDGAIADDEWSNLVGYFFRQNEMVLEYLNPDYQTKS